MFKTPGMTKSTASGLGAVLIVALGALAMEQGHAGGAPRGSVEIGTLQAEQVGSMPVATLPEIQVIGSRRPSVVDGVAAQDAGTRG